MQTKTILEELLNDANFPKLLEKVEAARIESSEEFLLRSEIPEREAKVLQDLTGNVRSILEKAIEPIARNLEFPVTITKEDVAEVLLNQIAGRPVELLMEDPELLPRVTAFLLHRTLDTINPKHDLIKLSDDEPEQDYFYEAPEKFEDRCIDKQTFSVFTKPHCEEQKHFELAHSAILEIEDLVGDTDTLAKHWVTNDCMFVESKQFYRPVWKSSHGPLIYLLPEWQENDLRGYPMYSDATTSIVLLGHFTRLALPTAIAELKRTFVPILKIIGDSAVNAEIRVTSWPSFTRNLSFEFSPLSGIDARYQKYFELENCTHPSLAFMYSPDAQAMFNCLMEIAHSDQSRLPVLEFRIANALHWLSIEPSVSDDGVAIALSVNAIESLLVGPGQKPVKCFKDYVSTLLVTELSKRKLARGQLNRIYDWRCHLMHGRRIDCPNVVRKVIRRIACGVLRGVISYRKHMQCMEKAITFKDLLDELEISHRKGHFVVGVSNLSDLLAISIPSK